MSLASNDEAVGVNLPVTYAGGKPFQISDGKSPAAR